MAGHTDNLSAPLGEGPGIPDTHHDPGEQQMRARLVGSLFGQPVVDVKVGRYVVLDQIGSGGLGVVYAAYDPELDRKVALKLVKPTMLLPRAAARMQREAQAMAKIKHPNVVAVYDTGPHAEGVFIAMELVDGVTLTAWRRAQPRPWKAIREVLVSAGRGLAAAHGQGLVHRDFKPANVLVEASGQARVLDFGLARAAQTEGAQEAGTDSVLDVEVTQTGTLLGTPAYMAPEQFEGHADERSDQWGFCVTAYEMLYGRRPFTGPDADAVRDAARSGRVPRPEGTSPVPSWLFRALARGMSVDPAQRFPSMDALLVEMQRDKRSRRLGLAGIALAVVLSSGGTASALLLTQPEPSAESQALVEQLESQARQAADAGRFIYPTPDEPEQATALVNVIALEQIEGPIAPEAKQRASQLRQEFADALVALGDRYYDEEVAFASDFYAAALLFDARAERARERSPLTPGELSVLRTKAQTAEFSDVEVSGAAPLAALAEADPERRTRKVRELLDQPTADSTARRLERLIEPAPKPRPSPPEPRTDATAVALAPDEAVEATGEQPAEGPPRGDRPAAPTRDPEGAKADARAGQAALKRGAEAEAERAFYRALDKDSRNVAALVGLSELSFERAAYAKALRYAKKAAELAPKRGSIRVRLGDAYFKVHRYEDARREYETAEALGATDGARRGLARVQARVGD